MSSIASEFIASAVRSATPLGLAALGEVVVERAGIINISLEGVILCGAFGALVGSTHGGVLGGLAGALILGVGMAALFAWFVVRLGADQIIAGTALTMLALGGTGTLYRALYGAGGAALSIPTARSFRTPGLAALPIFGAIFDQPLVAYFFYLSILLVWFWMYRTLIGLALRAVGESPVAARAAGVRVERIRALSLLFGGAMGGLAGGTLVLAQAGTFAEGMSAGRGFIAIAIVVLGRWHPIGVGIAALVFGAANAVQYLLQAAGLGLPYQIFLALPYVLTLFALAGVAGRARAPAALAKVDDD